MESKQDYVSLILFRIIPVIYACHLTKKHLVSHAAPNKGYNGSHPSLRGEKAEVSEVRQDPPDLVSSVSEQGRRLPHILDVNNILPPHTDRLQNMIFQILSEIMEMILNHITTHIYIHIYNQILT